MKSILHRSGFTLVELVIALSVASIGVVALLKTYSSVVQRSADPMIAAQTIAIAESFMEEITAHAFLDPATGTVCPAAPASRNNFDNICDYNAYSTSTIVDLAGNTLSLTGYQVSVSVLTGAAVAGHLGAISGNDLVQIKVAVRNPLQETFLLSAYRTRY